MLKDPGNDVRRQTLERHAKRSLVCIFSALTLVCFTLFFSGCASVSIESVKDPTFSNPVHSMFIVLNHAQLDKIDSSDTPYLLAALKKEFSLKGVDIELREIDHLSPNEDIYKDEIADYKPDGVLTIVANAGATAGGGVMQIYYEISPYDFVKNRIVWRAQINAASGGGAREKKMKTVAKDLVQRLSDDKMISSEPRQAGKTM